MDNYNIYYELLINLCFNIFFNVILDAGFFCNIFVIKSLALSSNLSKSFDIFDISNFCNYCNIVKKFLVSENKGLSVNKPYNITPNDQTSVL